MIVFHTSTCWLLFTGVWVKVNLLKSPGLYSVFWTIFIMLSFGSSTFIIPLEIVPSVRITICITVTFKFHSFFQISSKVLVLISLFTLFQFYSVVSRNGSSLFGTFLFIYLSIFCLLSVNLVVWTRLDYYYYYYYYYLLF